MTLRITLAWPDKALWPNGGYAHRFAKAKAVKAARTAAWALTLEALKGAKPDWSGAKLSWFHHPKTAHLPDKDNCIASAKASQDGIAQALGIDDRHFQSTHTIAEPIKGGLVRVEITEAGAA
jgi:crossover junction endodeoxyribonuclease RusA